MVQFDKCFDVSGQSFILNRMRAATESQLKMCSNSVVRMPEMNYNNPVFKKGLTKHLIGL